MRDKEDPRWRRPLLLVDVDGVISLFGFQGAPPAHVSFHWIDGIPHFLSSRAARHLLELWPLFEAVWASGWEEKANEYLPQLLGLPGPLPHLSFERATGRSSAPAAGGSNAHVAGVSSARVAGGSDARVAGGSNAHVAGGSNARVAGGSNARVAGGSDAHWKLEAIDAYCGTRPLAWIDDSLNGACHEWAERRRSPTLLVQTRPERGLTERERDLLAGWAQALARRPTSPPPLPAAARAPRAPPARPDPR